LSGHNALLSLLSQDDFLKLKNEIHTHIDNLGGRIDEIAASEEEEHGEALNHQNHGGSDKDNIVNDFDDIDDDHNVHDVSDDDVIMTS
jgi:hypothetical protein